jgi:hypothetical protein
MLAGKCSDKKVLYIKERQPILVKGNILQFLVRWFGLYTAQPIKKQLVHNPLSLYLKHHLFQITFCILQTAPL